MQESKIIVFPASNFMEELTNNVSVNAFYLTVGKANFIIGLIATKQFFMKTLRIRIGEC